MLLGVKKPLLRIVIKVQWQKSHLLSEIEKIREAVVVILKLKSISQSHEVTFLPWKSVWLSK